MSVITQKLVFPKRKAVTVEMTVICFPRKGEQQVLRKKKPRTKRDGAMGHRIREGEVRRAHSQPFLQGCQTLGLPNSGMSCRKICDTRQGTALASVAKEGRILLGLSEATMHKGKGYSRLSSLLEALVSSAVMPPCLHSCCFF